MKDHERDEAEQGIIDKGGQDRVDNPEPVLLIFDEV